MDTELEKVRQELALAKAARDEWMVRWQAAELRVTSIWDLAIDSARMRIGHHVPRCLDKCHQCWIYDELATMMRGDPNNYMPVKERMRKRIFAMKEKCTLPNKERKAYAKALDEIYSSVEKMLADKE